MAEKKNTVSRRGFIGRIGAAAAATALPAVVAGKSTPTRTDDRHAIPGLPAETMDTLRAWYAAAVAEVATQLRPRFESGELHGWRDEDSAGVDSVEGREDYIPSPWRVENECGKRFVRGSMPRAYFILAVSPSEIETFDGACTDPRYHAANAMGYDVIRYARGQGWTVMTADEEGPAVVPSTRRYYCERRGFRGWNGRGEG